jgi:hypothetical protein
MGDVKERHTALDILIVGELYNRATNVVTLTIPEYVVATGIKKLTFKGAVVVGLVVDGQGLIFASVHLAAHSDPAAMSARKRQLESIIRRVEEAPELAEIHAHPHIIILGGDFNTRTQILEPSQTKNRASEEELRQVNAWEAARDWESFGANDQMTELMRTGLASSYQTPALNTCLGNIFPTFKLVIPSATSPTTITTPTTSTTATTTTTTTTTTTLLTTYLRTAAYNPKRALSFTDRFLYKCVKVPISLHCTLAPYNEHHHNKHHNRIRLMKGV